MTMINDNDAVDKSRRVETKANELVQLFNSSTSYEFYCKTIYELGFEAVDNLVDKTIQRKANNPGAYFNVLARKEMRRVR